MKATSEESKKALIKSWLDKEAVPIEQAVFGAGSSQSLFNKILMFFVQRPLVRLWSDLVLLFVSLSLTSISHMRFSTAQYIFGLLYFAKKILLYLEELGKDEIEGGEL